MFKLLGHDFFITGSGVGGTQGRLNNILNPLNYFAPDNHHAGLPLGECVPGILDFAHNRWDYSWPFIGWGVVAFAIAGLLCSKHRAKWPFAMAIALVILANAPVKLLSLWSVAHWINAFTNPFSFLLRSFHMPVLLMPFLFLPLAALGLQAAWDFARRGDGRRKGAVAGIIGMVLTADLGMAAVYARQYPPPGMEAAPRVRFALAGARPLFLDYQNPLHLPFREYVRALPVPTPDPQLNSGQNLYGLFYKYSPLERYFREPNLYDPLPKAYKDFYNDQDGQGHNFTEYYLNQDTRWIFIADAAVPSELMPRPVWLSLHLERRIALVEGAGPAAPGVVTRGQDIPAAMNSPAPARARTFSFDCSQARRRAGKEFMEYYFNLPADFPKYEATSIFTKDKERIKAAVDALELLPVQGKITGPFNFDVNNVRKGQLAVSLPADYPSEGKKIRLTLTQSGEILNVWRNEHDRIGLTYLAAAGGWMVIHLPYDPKWRISIDGQPAQVWRVNKYFIGTPVTQGRHQVLIEYWPSGLLRPLILVSIILTFAALAGAVIFGLRREHKNPANKKRMW
ncbi:MAG: YfhO family protein [Candidatus Omnitrophica bacterium]|nr:YfhO family protein [Candidatus Omnitrophota bacterium]